MTCTWEPDTEILGTGTAWAALSDEQQERALLLATISLQVLTNNRVGTCPITIRPCPQTRRCHCAWNPYVGSDGLWRNGCVHRTLCKPLAEVDIPGPVGYIDSLLINGETQDLWNGDYRLDDGHLLVWQGSGPSPFLETQDLNKPDSEPGTWSITYSRSYPVGADARMAVAYLALEFSKALIPKTKCSLPRGARNVARNGVTFEIEAGLFPNGLTGLDTVDPFILKWAPAGSPARSAVVFDPRKVNPRVTTGVPARSLLGSN